VVVRALSGRSSVPPPTAIPTISTRPAAPSPTALAATLPTPTLAPTPRPTSAPPTITPVPTPIELVEVHNIGDALAAASTYQLHASIETTWGPPLDVIWESARPYRACTRMTDRGRSEEMLIVGKDIFYKSGSNGWHKQPDWMHTQDVGWEGFNSDSLIESFRDAQQYVVGDIDAVDDAP
jgi:hypothetical protein